MNKHKDIVNELKQLAPDANWPAEAPFVVPAGYFEQFPAAMLLQVHLEAAPDAGVIAAASPFTAPAGYFDSLPSVVMARISTPAADPVREELETISPLIAAIPREVPFSVPAGYFEALTATPPAPAAPLRVVRRNPARAWLKWAVAACLTAFAGTTALIFLEKNSNTIEKQLEGLDDQDIVYYLQNHTDAFDNDAIFASFADVPASETLQKQLSEEIPPAAIEQYLQQADMSKEVLPNQ